VAKTVSLVLGSGGARGLAHIGVIQWLAENDYEIRSVSGSSIGALIGGIYAAGKLDAYAEWVLALERMQVLRLLDPSFGRAGLFKGERIMAVLRELIGEFDIEHLPISFTAVATDLHSGAEVWLREGNLFDAIRASIATPLIFTPHTLAGRMLVDGGLVNPVPVAPTLADTTELTVAVDLSGRFEAQPPPEATSAPIPDANNYAQRIRAFVESLQGPKRTPAPTRGMFDIAMAAMDTMQSTIARLKLAAYAANVVIEIPRNACGYIEFWRAEEMITLGRERARQAFEAAVP
jgi:NTE family protein